MLHLQGAPTRRPFSDWMSDVARQLERRTGETAVATESYWLALYHCGESVHVAADEFLEDWNRRSRVWL
jgi:hypothetical protein